MEFTRRPRCAVVPQCGPAKTSDRTIHWIDLHMGPITWQIRDTVGPHSATEVPHRAYKTAVAVFLDGPDYAGHDPTVDEHQVPA
jgi:hypothetical protein